MPNLLDLMSEEDRQLMISLADKRKRNGGFATVSVSPEAYLVAELGYYYGWSAIESVKRGFVETFDDNGNKRKIILSMDEVQLLVEAARKVWYNKLIEMGRSTQVAAASVMSKHAKKAFTDGMKPFMERARL